MLDETTIRRAMKGNDRAFQELIQEEKEKLYRMAYLYVKNQTDALDIVQETIYKAYISIDKLKHTEYFSTWLTRILINEALKFTKRNKGISPIADVESLHSIKIPLLDDSIDLIDAVNRLESQYKNVIILRYYRDFTVKQIAETLERPEGTIKTYLHRAIKKLQIDLEGSYAK